MRKCWIWSHVLIHYTFLLYCITKNWYSMVGSVWIKFSGFKWFFSYRWFISFFISTIQRTLINFNQTTNTKCISGVKLNKTYTHLWIAFSAVFMCVRKHRIAINFVHTIHTVILLRFCFEVTINAHGSMIVWEKN